MKMLNTFLVLLPIILLPFVQSKGARFIPKPSGKLLIYKLFLNCSLNCCYYFNHSYQQLTYGGIFRPRHPSLSLPLSAHCSCHQPPSVKLNPLNCHRCHFLSPFPTAMFHSTQRKTVVSKGVIHSRRNTAAFNCCEL